MKSLTTNIKIVVIAAAIIAAALFATKSPAQSKSPSLKTVEVICATERELEETIVKKFKERPMLVMRTSRELNGKEVDLITILFVNPETKSWTLAEKWSENEICVVSVGTGITPFINPGNPV
jgi:hypothetical protein